MVKLCWAAEFITPDLEFHTWWDLGPFGCLFGWAVCKYIDQGGVSIVSIVVSAPHQLAVSDSQRRNLMHFVSCYCMSQCQSGVSIH